MAYQYGGNQPVEQDPHIKLTVMQQRQQALTLESEAKKMVGRLKTLEHQKAAWAKKIEASREELAAIRKQATHELACLENEKYKARQEIIDAQRQAALIKEMATDQARALSERAYRSGFERGKDIAKAKHAVFAKVLKVEAA